jgi:glycosyltransferase involved in cell wall biosynthesis
MIHELYFPNCETTRLKVEAIKRADHIICISHNTKKDLCEMFDISENKVSVTHLAYEDFSGYQGTKTRDDEEKKSNPYFLFVGNRSLYKNFSAMLTAYGASEILKSESKIACFGGGSLTKDELSFAKKQGICESKIMHLGSNDQDLGKAYSNAIALVYPSQYEGFGIPPLEAMSANCPVICSNNSSLPEVVGSAALTFDPLNNDEIRHRMEEILCSKSLRDTLIKKGFQQKNKFSWDLCAQETNKIYQKII